MVPKVREVVGVLALIATGQALPIWAASLTAFALACVLVGWRMRRHSRR